MVHRGGEYSGWREITGVQGEGIACPVDDDEEHREAWALYLGKYPFVRELYPLGLPRLAEISSRAGRAIDEMARRLGSVRLYRVAATRLNFIDNGEGFGKRVEVSL